MIILQNLSKSFGSKDLFKHINYNFPQNAKIALIGNNGEGKTSLLNILCGFDNDYSGEIIVPKGVRLAYLPQHLNNNPKNTIIDEALDGAIELNAIDTERQIALNQMGENFSDDLYAKYEFLEQKFQAMNGYKIKDLAETILLGLGFKNDQLITSPRLLSGGWHMRLELAKILLNNPNFLILDEPTNHLDLPSIIWLENYLKKFDGTILFVTHDQDLLNKLADHILHLKSCQITPYKGNFAYFLDVFAMKQEQSVQQVKNLKRESDHIQKFVDRFRYTASKASMVQSRLKTLSKLKFLEDGIQHETLSSNMLPKISNVNQSGKTVLKIKDLLIGYDKPLFEKLNLEILRGKRIAILGANGLGKTTLLRTLLQDIKPLNGQIEFGYNVNPGYFAQKNINNLLEEITILQNITESNSTIKEFEARKLLGSLGIRGDDVYKLVKVLSGGEKSRVALASILALHPNTLFLDEPTNHLDLYACENLANAFIEYSGTIIFVSHNRAFIETVATDVLHVRPQKKLFLESVEDRQLTSILSL